MKNLIQWLMLDEILFKSLLDELLTEFIAEFHHPSEPP
jgi:hypothetical protein